MKTGFIKKIFVLFFIALSVFAVICLSGCAPKAMKQVPFNLISMRYKPDWSPPNATLIKSVDEFESFLSDREIFTETQSEEFIKENKKYDSAYFEKNDLIALILGPESSSVTGHELKDIYKDFGGVWRVKVQHINPGQYATADLANYFCYYLTVEKDAKMTNVGLAR